MQRLRPFFAPLRGFAAVVAALALAPNAAMAQPAPVEVLYGELNPTAGEWPVYLAESQGFFKDEGIKFTVINGGSAPNVVNQLATGATNLANNGCDSEIAAIGRGLPFKIVASSFNVNPYSLVVLPSIKTWADLKGKNVILGTKQDVTAIALEQMAAAHNLKMDDFSIVIGGSSPARYAALSSGNVQGALLTQPFDLLAESKGMNVLGSAADTIKEWTFTCIGANNAWAAKNRPLVVKFLRAVRKGVQYGYAHKDAAVKTLVDFIHVDPVIAAKAYDLDFTKWHAFDPNMKTSIPTLQAVAKYQINFGVLREMPKIDDMIDPSYAAEAAR